MLGFIEIRVDPERPLGLESDLWHGDSGSMSFLKTVESARAFLERNGRVSPGALQREFNLDDDALAELIEELELLASGTRLAKPLERIARAVGGYDFEGAIETLPELDTVLNEYR